MTSDKIDYDFKATSADDFEILLTMEYSNMLMELLFNKAAKKLKQTKNIDVVKNKEVDNFAVPTEYLRLLNNVCAKPMRDISKQVLADGIIISSWWAHKAIYKRKDKNTWYVEIKLVGMYRDTRVCIA